MKKFKKLSLSLMLSSVALLTVACSELDKIGNDISNHVAKPAEETTTKKLSEADTIRRIIGKMQSLKSWEVESTTKITQIVDGQNREFQGQSISQYIGNPYTLKREDKISDGTEQAIYVKDGVLYQFSKVQGKEEWEKGTIPQDKVNNHKRNQAYTYYKALVALVQTNKDFTLKETDSTYEIEFKPTNANELKEMLFGTPNESIKDFKIEEFSAKYIVDKATLLPTSMERTESMSYSTAEIKSFKTTTISKDTLKNTNSVSEIKIPDGHTNAQDTIKFG